MTDHAEPEDKKPQDIRARLGRLKNKSNASEASEAPATPKAPGDIMPPPSFVGKESGPRTNPFAATTAAQGMQTEQEVRIVVDENAIASANEGLHKQTRKMMWFVGIAVGVIGLLLGTLASTVIINRRTYNQTVRDGKAIYAKVRDASDRVAEAKVLVDQAMKAARPQHDTEPTVDYEAIEKLQSMPIPFSPSDFIGRHYSKFSRETANFLFTYTRRVDELWNGFDQLGVDTLPESRKTALNEAAQDETAITTTPTGCVPVLGKGGFRCSLVYVNVPEAGFTTGKVQVRSTPNGRTFDKELYTGQDIRRKSSNYVILTNPQQSQGVIGQRQNVFTQYRQELESLATRMALILEVQGHLEKGLGQIAGLQELSGF